MKSSQLLVAVVSAVVIFFGTGMTAGAASARGLSFKDAHVGNTRSELVQQAAYSQRVIRSLSGSWKVAPRHRTCWSHVPWAKTCDRARQKLIAQRWLHGLAERRLTTLYPSVVAPAIPAYLKSAFLCIHRYEGAWNDNTGNGYYGGLQMDWSFQNLYGRDFLQKWGTADKWPPWAQEVAAVRAYQSGRGFYPWPNTARACGLL